LFIVEVFPVRERDKVFELRLYELASSLALVCNGVVSNVAFRVDLKGKGVTSLGLFLSEVERILCDMALRVGTTVAEILLR
jgi:hypothetical protein